MKKKYIWLLSCVVLLTGCGNRESLVCTSTTESDEATSYATLDIDIKDNKIYDMEFTVDMEFPEEYTSQLRTIVRITYGELKEVLELQGYTCE